VPPGGVSGADAARPKRRITLFLTGGASALETWDPKPQAPREIRGPFRPISTSSPGLFISELFPRLAQRAHWLTVVRGMTGSAPAIHASLYPLRPDVVLGPWPDVERRREPAGFLPWVPAPAAPERNDAPWVDATGHKPRRPGRFGPSRFARNCARAFDLLEAGAPHVLVHQFEALPGEVSWDLHAQPHLLPTTFDDYRSRVAPELDQAVAALLDELHAAARLHETVVALVTECGRTPQLNRFGGRDHQADVWSNVVAGGAFQTGAAWGASDGRGASVLDRPTTPAQFERWLAVGVQARGA
jgi:hypothetical protein